MKRDYIMPICLIVIAADLLWRDALHGPFLFATAHWVDQVIDVGVFITMAEHIWRGRAYR